MLKQLMTCSKRDENLNMKLGSMGMHGCHARPYNTRLARACGQARQGGRQRASAWARPGAVLLRRASVALADTS